VLAGDELTLLTDGVTGLMADKNAGLAKAVTLDGVAFGGADAGNYSVQTAGDLRVDISPRLLAVTGAAQGKVYDGSTAASVTYTDDRLTGDSLGIGHQAAVFASRNAGTGVVVNVTGLALTGDDAGNYALAGDTLSLSADIERRALALEAVSLGKIYGQTLSLPGSGFTASGLVSGETVGSVVLGSAGAGAAANVGSYALQISGASGGSFDPDNYQLSYVDGQLTVTPRPLTITAHTVVRYADQPNPGAWGYASRPGDLVNGDALGGVLIPAPAGSEGASGGSVFTLQPEGAVLATGLASNYELRYANGLLIVLPQPPRFDDVDGGTTGGGDPQFAIQVSPEEVADAVQALRRVAGAVRAANLAAPPGPDPRAQGGDDATQGTADLLAALLRGETQRITLPALLRLPLISLDPKLRRLIVGAASTDPTR
jgi:trimeric autotransporter adhesin